MSKLLVVWSLVLTLALFAGCGSSSGTSVDPGTPEVTLTLHPKGVYVFTHGNKRGANVMDQYENHTSIRPDHTKKQGVDVFYRSLGQSGRVFWTEAKDVYSLQAQMDWPSESKTDFELTIDYDSKADPRPFKLAVTGFQDVTATRDGEPVSLPAELPAGKYQVKVKGKIK
jgi:hypothetical protein